MKRTVIGLFFLTFALWGQEEHILTTGATLHVPVSVDRVFSDVPRLGVGGMLDLGYRYLGRNQSHNLRFLIGGGALFPQYHLNNSAGSTYLAANELMIGLRLDLRSTFKFYETDLILARVGGYLLASFEFTIPNFLAYSWVGEVGAGIAGEVLLRFGKHNLEFMLALPLGALLSRPYWPGYIAEDEFDLEDSGLATVIFGRTMTVSLGNYVRLELTGLYTYRLNERVSFAARYDFLYRYVRVPQASTTFGHLLSFNVYLHFLGRKR